MVCTCAQKMYRNNADGTQSFRLKGNLRCPKCRGKGRCVKCPECDGAGIPAIRQSLQSQVCQRCYGSGYVPAQRAPR